MRSVGILLQWKEDCIAVKDSAIGIFSISIERKIKDIIDGWIQGIYAHVTPTGVRSFDRNCLIELGYMKVLGVWRGTSM